MFKLDNTTYYGHNGHKQKPWVLRTNHDTVITILFVLVWFSKRVLEHRFVFLWR